MPVQAGLVTQLFPLGLEWNTSCTERWTVFLRSPSQTAIRFCERVFSTMFHRASSIEMGHMRQNDFSVDSGLNPPIGKPIPDLLPLVQALEDFDLGFLNAETTDFFSTTQDVVQRAMQALDQQRHRDLELLRKHAELFTQFNLNCRAVREFVYELVKESNQFKCTFEYLNEPRQFWVRFTLSFGEGKYQRRFPIYVVYQREPQFATLVKIDLFEIGKTHQTRIGRMEQLNIGWLESRFGYYVTMPRSIAEHQHVVKWLKHAFTRIFPKAYQE